MGNPARLLCHPDIGHDRQVDAGGPDLAHRGCAARRE